MCSLYLLFGIAMIAMSFNLLQEEVRNTVCYLTFASYTNITFHSKVINSVKSLGKMCGIIKDNEDEEEY